MIIALAFCLLVASFDEFHQMFVQGRTPLVTDVFIDTAGGIFGIIIMQSVTMIQRIFTHYTNLR